MANLQSLIKQHNPEVLTDGKKHTRLRNCRYKEKRPLPGKCLGKYIVYKAEVTTTEKRKLHYGKSDGDFKTIKGTSIQLILNFPNTSGN